MCGIYWRKMVMWAEKYDHEIIGAGKYRKIWVGEKRKFCKRKKTLWEFGWFRKRNGSGKIGIIVASSVVSKEFYYKPWGDQHKGLQSRKETWTKGEKFSRLGFAHQHEEKHEKSIEIGNANFWARRWELGEFCQEIWKATGESVSKEDEENLYTKSYNSQNEAGNGHYSEPNEQRPPVIQRMFIKLEFWGFWWQW